MANQFQPDPLLVQMFREALQAQLQKNYSLALVAYKRIQGRFPSFVDAWANGSAVLWELGRFHEAHEMAMQATALEPENPDALCSLANAQQSLGDMESAETNFLKAIENNPNHVPAMTNLAGIYNRSGNFPAALDLGEKAIEKQPTNSALWGNRGHSRMRALDLVGAEADLRHALQLDANNALARWNLAYTLLLQCRYKEAWPHFGARKELAEWSADVQNFGKPRWNGEPLNGRALLIYSEQGFGDTLHFSRFATKIKDIGGRTLLAAQKPLLRLLSFCQGIDVLLDEAEPLPEFDLVAPLMELPAILGLDEQDMGPLAPPVLPPSQEIPELIERGNSHNFKVGLVWAGNSAHTNDKLRSIDAKLLENLCDIHGGTSEIAWFGLQKPPANSLPRLPGMIDLSPRMGDFLDTAQIINQLDLVVTVDTAVAHLAGLLGQRCIAMLAYMPDWRWGLKESAPHMYSSLTLLRQPSHGDWPSVMAVLKERIAGMMTASGR
jgi:tetratricopeptide (TPR) repeat protein